MSKHYNASTEAHGGGGVFLKGGVLGPKAAYLHNNKELKLLHLEKCCQESSEAHKLGNHATAPLLP